MAAQSGPTAYLLDITRLLRRAGRVPTGVDRVELAYLTHFMQLDTPVFGLARTRLGYVLLDRAGLQAFGARVQGHQPWGAPDRLSWGMRLSVDQKRAESDLRRWAIARCLPQRLPRMLRRNLSPGGVYLNVGHSNLTQRVLHSVRHHARLRIAVMIHDTIPLDFPDLQRPETEAKFQRMLKRVQQMADLVICNSGQTQADVTRHMAKWGMVPDTVVAHLGVEIAPVTHLPDIPGFDPNKAFFVTLGTIEPRKNHALLLSLWEEMGQDAPQLVICGHRGWRNEAVLQWLDRNPLVGHRVFECAGLPDGQVNALLRASKGLLFPSVTEGYGLPPIEAAAQNVPVICNDLPVYRETMGDIPVYAGIHDRYLWQNKIMGLMRPQGADRQVSGGQGVGALTWQQHFNAVLRRL
ncbi:glycosyltransferase [Thalassobius sp. S69A]|uniref:glycosyltransferase n=1 Tax=unclassified Thalassovita TaxID=2619711 RepID=UPI000C0ECF35|nr:glycosyl transferase [Paracoccaceae bacterium]MBT25646.1 glycosyl transferase [Paracoccaceae bacterium]